MRWIDIILPEPETHHKLDGLLARAARQWALVDRIQERDGLDNVSVVNQMAKVGHLLFQGVQACSPEAFHPGEDQPGYRLAQMSDPEHDDLVGFHLVVDPRWAGLPWTWLHNGLEFLLEKNPIVSSNRVSSLPQGQALRPWMQRCRRAEFLVDDSGGSTLAGTLDQLRPLGLARPELLFVPGHTDEKIRRMIYREAEAIDTALAASSLVTPLVDLHVPAVPVTPDQLSGLSLAYQALHFAGSVSQPAYQQDPAQAHWMDRLVEELNAPADRELEAALGLEGEILGVDPITSLLDDVSQRYEQEQVMGGQAGQTGAEAGGRPGQARPVQKHGAGSSSPWLLEDGPVHPESLGQGGGVPPLVFSNSYLALPELGQRFLAAGASTFIGPVVPVFSRPARIFSSYCYQALGEGWCAGAAVWKAARECRRELGGEHPAWLSYGLHGYGSLSLQYL